MALKYALDTCTVINLLNKKNDRVFFEIMRHNLDEVCIPIVVAAELKYGACKSQRKEKNLNSLNEFLRRVAILPMDIGDAEEYGELRTILEERGQPIGGNDLFIAAQARRRGLVVVTNNTREFARVPDLLVDDWT